MRLVAEPTEVLRQSPDVCRYSLWDLLPKPSLEAQSEGVDTGQYGGPGGGADREGVGGVQDNSGPRQAGQVGGWCLGRVPGDVVHT